METTYEKPCPDCNGSGYVEVVVPAHQSEGGTADEQVQTKRCLKCNQETEIEY